VLAADERGGVEGRRDGDGLMFGGIIRVFRCCWRVEGKFGNNGGLRAALTGAGTS